MASRAEKSGFALDAQRKIRGKYDPELASEILTWIAAITGDNFDKRGDLENFVSTLKDGTVLCSLANALEPGAVKKVNTSKMAFKQMENISFFLEFATKHVPETELFQTIDLYEGQDPNAVLICLASLARKSEKLFGKKGLGPKEAEGEKRAWTEQQLRAGEGVIGSNKGATASGINIGNTRHM
ncbi:unnamed protein product [Anisakis simplex]|uniref:CPN-1 (inferred by orthology to a C. elegans protein) n=1 Tax=Anisakis simplex TaxID=6269 RepID=A0A0M3JCG1_ANISI|nr:unnamed protein product [Anisakis simplex]